MKRTIEEISAVEDIRDASSDDDPVAGGTDRGSDGNVDPIAGDSSNSRAVSDTDKLMYIAYRVESLHMQSLEFDYDWGYVLDAFKRTNPSATPDEELTDIMMFQEDTERSRYIDRLLVRRRLDDAFECAIRS